MSEIDELRARILEAETKLATVEALIPIWSTRLGFRAAARELRAVLDNTVPVPTT